MAKRGFFRRIGEFLGVISKTPPPKTPSTTAPTSVVSLRKPAQLKKSEDYQLASDEFRTLDGALGYASSLPSSRKVIISAYGRLSRPNDYNNPIGWGNLSERWALPGLVGKEKYKQRMIERQRTIFEQVSKYHVINEAR